MTRLTAGDIGHIESAWQAYEEDFKNACGLRLWDLACETAETGLLTARPLVGVVSINYGQGLISGFRRMVASIAGHLGFPVIEAEVENFAGWAEVMARGAEVVLCSDDDFFGAFHLRTGRVAENSRATGRAYAQCLAAMAGGVAGREVQVLGAGPVGRAGAERLVQLGARVAVHDRNRLRAEELAAAFPDRVRPAAAGELAQAAEEGGLFLQAAPDARALDWARLSAGRSLVAHPAVPFSLPEHLRAAWRGRVWHDPLELGTAAMLAQVLI